MTTAECISYIIEWTKENLNSVPTDDDMPWIGEARMKVIRKSHMFKSNWKRRAKQTTGDTTYRAFECNCSIIQSGVIFVLVEQAGELTRVEVGTRKEFEGKYFTRIPYSFE